MPAKKPEVLVIMGSASDNEVMQESARVLEDFGVEYAITVASAHRSPERTRKLVTEAAGKGIKVIVCGAGMAAHLAGVAASHTLLPVIGVPMAAGPCNGLDALLSTVQMPPGVPVAAVAAGSAGAKNAAFLALRILALSDRGLLKKLGAHVKKMEREVAKAAGKIEGKCRRKK